MKSPIVIAIDGPSASGKSTNAKLVARALGYVYVDTGAMYRTLAWYCLKNGVDVHDGKAVGAVLRRWKTRLDCVDDRVRLLVDGHSPEQEIRTAETSAAVPHVAAVDRVRDWMVKLQRTCTRFGNLVMEGRDIGTNVFPKPSSSSTSMPPSRNGRVGGKRTGCGRIWPGATGATASARPRR